MGLKARELADRLKGTLRDCDPELEIEELRSLEEAGPRSLSFLSNPKYAPLARASKAALLLVDPKADLGPRPVLVMDQPYWGFAQCLGWLHPEPEPDWSSEPIHPRAVLEEGVCLGPGCTVGARSHIGRNSRIHAGVHIAEDCRIGEGCELFPGVILYRRTILGRGVRIHANSVLGSDGYGYVFHEGRHEKIPQIGWVELGDEVEIGAGVTIDRGALGATRLGAGTKVDNLVQIAHNVQTGQHCLIVSQVGISGSVKLGDYVVLAGKVGVAGHLEIGSRSTVIGNSVVAKSLPEGSEVAGYPARPHRQWLETQAAINQLPRLLKQFKQRKP